MDRTIEFDVTIWLGGGDGGNVCVSISVSDEEYELLKKCYLEDCEPCDCEGLEDLCNRVEEVAIDEAEYIADEYDQDVNCDYATCSFWIPCAIVNECDSERKENEE